MPHQARRYACVCEHPRGCACEGCTREFAEYFAAIRELDELVARDPEAETARDEFAAWVGQDPPAICPEVMP